LTASKSDTARPVKKHPGRLVLLGNPVSHSLSPLFQNAALLAAQIPLVYEAIDVKSRDLNAILRELKESNAAGNVTIPHKISVHDRCDALSELAAKVGAVNTFSFESGRLYGDNTDVGGFDAAARALLGGEVKGTRLLLFGAGGAAAAVIAAAEEWPESEVSIVARNADRAALLARRFPDVARVEKSVKRAVARATLIVNATPIGQRDGEHPLDVALIPATAAVMDLGYRRGGTSWVKAVREKGNRAADGLPMLLEQGALSFRLWFGVAPDREAMRLSLV
jgi:shikimate dehydrogenase